MNSLIKKRIKKLFHVGFIVKSYLFLIPMFFLVIIYPGNISAQSQPKLIFNVTGQSPLNTENQDGFMDEVTREALKRIGYKLIVKRQPAERGLRSINKGLIDGEMSRVKGIEKKYTNLIRVPEKIMTWDFVVFSKKKLNLIKGWGSFENKNISFINGWKILEKNVPKTAYVTKTKNSEQLFKLLEKNRTDFVIYEHWGGHRVIEKLKLNDVSILSPVLESKEMYIYLHKRHAALIPMLSKALLNMKNDGSYKRLSEKFLKKEMGIHSQ